MNVYLTFDVEIWCNGWDDLDRKFLGSFERYVYGRSRHGAWALPKTLEILQWHGLKGVFFVEPLFAARFGSAPLREIVGLIRAAGQEVQLHLHPEWTDEAIEPLIEDCTRKRQHLIHYTPDEQAALIGHGRRLLQASGSGPLTAFRSGSYAANRATYDALGRNGIFVDSSLNRCHAISGGDLRDGDWGLDTPHRIGPVLTLPVAVFRDGFGRRRPAQVGACGAWELRSALQAAERAGHTAFVIVSHNFEMLRSGSSAPDWIVARRFAALCAFLARHRERFPVRGFGDPLPGVPPAAPDPVSTGVLASGWRLVEQARRRLPPLARGR